jgi:hypothetical protein
MDNLGELLYIKFDTCPPLYWYLGVYRRLRLACPPHANEAAVSFRFVFMDAVQVCQRGENEKI